MSGFLFVTFTDGRDDGEQIYMALSRDGLHWKDLNGGEPVLCSDIGECGARDPFIIRRVDGKGFFLIATDLRIAAGKGWQVAQYEGSRGILIWESENLVDWSPVRSATLGVEGAGCVWAPEIIFDEERNSYLVFFASMIALEGDEKPKQRIYASYTKDFRDFEPAFLYMEMENHVIDMTIIRDGGRYYRIYKDETTKNLRMDAGNALCGSFQEVRSRTLETLPGVEGPECYYLEEQGCWCLIADQFASQKGYLPILIRDLEAGDMEIIPEERYDLGGFKKRHGGVIPISDEEYERLENKYL